MLEQTFCNIVRPTNSGFFWKNVTLYRTILMQFRPFKFYVFATSSIQILCFYNIFIQNFVFLQHYPFKFCVFATLSIQILWFCNIVHSKFCGFATLSIQNFVVLQHCQFKFCGFATLSELQILGFLGKCYIIPDNFNAISPIQILCF